MTSTAPPSAQLMLVREVADEVGVCPETIRALIARGELASIRLGGARGWHRVRRKDVEALLEGRKPSEDFRALLVEAAERKP